MKKRYQLTLTEENVNRFQAIAEQLKMPKSTMSSMLDESLAALVKNMEKWMAQGKVTMVDLFTTIGEQLDELSQEGKQDDQKQPEKKKSRKPDTSKVYRR